MTYTISTDSPPSLSLCEEDPLKSILQNVYLILATRTGTIPMYRQFGLPMSFIDRPGIAAQTVAASEIREAIGEFEPRAKVTDISYMPSADGAKLTVKVEVGA